MAVRALLIVQTRTGHKVLAIDDERRMELDRVAQPARVRELTDLKMIALVEADDLPAVADRTLYLGALALEEAVWQTARAVALVVRKAGGVDAEHGVIAADDLRNVRAVVAEALAGADIDVFRLFAERELACIFQSERVLARLFDDKDAMLYIERQHRVALPGLEAGVVALRGRVIDEIELKALVALFLDVRIFVEEALELGLVQLAVQLGRIWPSD